MYSAHPFSGHVSSYFLKTNERNGGHLTNKLALDSDKHYVDCNLKSLCYAIDNRGLDRSDTTNNSLWCLQRGRTDKVLLVLLKLNR